MNDALRVDWSTMEAGREMDEAVARLLGEPWRVGTEWVIRGGSWLLLDSQRRITAIRHIPRYSTYSASDHEVLEHVRQTWSEGRQAVFHYALWDVWEARAKAEDWAFLTLAYQPGDYSRAALAALASDADHPVQRPSVPSPITLTSEDNDG